VIPLSKTCRLLAGQRATIFAEFTTQLVELASISQFLLLSEQSDNYASAHWNFVDISCLRGDYFGTSASFF
jgi:hypothetical protein